MIDRPVVCDCKRGNFATLRSEMIRRGSPRRGSLSSIDKIVAILPSSLFTGTPFRCNSCSSVDANVNAYLQNETAEKCIFDRTIMTTYVYCERVRGCRRIDSRGAAATPPLRGRNTSHDELILLLLHDFLSEEPV